MNEVFAPIVMSSHERRPCSSEVPRSLPGMKQEPPRAGEGVTGHA